MKAQEAHVEPRLHQKKQNKALIHPRVRGCKVENE